MIYNILNGTNPWSRVWAACLLLLLVPLAQAQAPEAYGKSDDPVVAEPLDAYHDFFKAAQKSGEFRIINKEFEPALWSYYTTDSIHTFIPESGNEKEHAINTPWWMMERKTGQ